MPIRMPEGMSEDMAEDSLKNMSETDAKRYVKKMLIELSKNMSQKNV